MHAGAIVLLGVFTAIASIDGFYFHIYRYRLYARPECAFEHNLHTVNAVLFPLTLAPLFLADTSGIWLWLNAGVLLLTLGVEAWDVITEGQSRARLGGLTPTEYLMHFLMSGLRWGSISLAFAARPAGAWAAASAWSWRSPLESPLTFVAWCIALTSIPVAVMHVLLASRGSLRRLGEIVLGLRPLVLS